MRAKTTLQGQLVALKLMPIVLLAIAFASAIQLWIHTVDAIAKTEHQTAVISSAQVLLEKMLDAETGARGYAATARTVFLEPYNSALLAIPAALERLSTLVAGDATQARYARQVKTLSARKIAILASYVASMQAGRPDQARAEVARALGKNTMDELRREIGMLESTVHGDTVTTLAQTKAAGLATLYALVFCTMFGIIFAAAAGWQIRRKIGRRVDLLVRKAENLSKGKAIGPRLDGIDEISDLDRAFHTMAELLAERTGDLERYRLLADRTQCLMLFARQYDGRILHANAAALATYRYSLAEITELTVDQLRSGEIPRDLDERLTAPSDVSLAYEADQRRSDGSTFPAEITVEGQLIAGQNVRLSIVRDISERRRTESLVADALGAARTAARAKADFLATMSHEIRTPMNAVIGMTELVLQTSLTEEQRQALETVNDSATALLRIIDDILDFSKIEAGKLNVEIIEFPFAKAIEAVAVTLAAQARARGLVLSVFVDPRAPESLYGDAGRVRQVLTNLVGNAIKFTPTGSVTLSADVTSATKEWCEVRFSVADTGIGIADEGLARIFQPFAQADASTTRIYGGSGLGLSICQQLVELMGGQLRADSVPDRGSTFSFLLRLRAGEASIPIERNELRALVVEPSSEQSSELTRYVRAWGLDVQVVASAGAALAAFAAANDEQRPFDVAIIDADNPAINVLALGSALAAHAPFATARRILVASNDEVERRTEAVAVGFSAYLVRPLRQSQLFDCVMNTAPVPASPRVEIQYEQTGLRILLAEDNMVNQRVALQQLHKLGYSATVVGTGRAALAAVIAERYDVVLMDCHMPEMDGYAATSAIRRHQARTGEHTPIIAMTANAQSGDHDTCIAAGMDDYLPKPVTLASLRDALARCCRPGNELATSSLRRNAPA
jgi:two-component system sensor histidine kinase/response regulator